MKTTTKINAVISAVEALKNNFLAIETLILTKDSLSENLCNAIADIELTGDQSEKEWLNAQFKKDQMLNKFIPLRSKVNTVLSNGGKAENVKWSTAYQTILDANKSKKEQAKAKAGKVTAKAERKALSLIAPDGDLDTKINAAVESENKDDQPMLAIMLKARIRQDFAQLLEIDSVLAKAVLSECVAMGAPKQKAKPQTVMQEAMENAKKAA